MTLIKLDEAIAAVDAREAMHENAWYKAPNNEAKCNLDARKWEAHDIAQALRALPTVSVTDEMVALQAENAELNAALAEQARIMDLWSAQLDTILEELKG